MKESTLDKIITEQVKKSIILLERKQVVGKFGQTDVFIMPKNGLLAIPGDLGLPSYQKKFAPGFEKDGQIYVSWEQIEDDFDGDIQAARAAGQKLDQLIAKAEQDKEKAGKEASAKSARDLALRIQAHIRKKYPNLVDFGKYVFDFTKKAPKGFNPGLKNVKGFGDFLPLTKEPKAQPNIGFTRRSVIGGSGQFVSPFNIPSNYQNLVNFYGVRYFQTGMRIGGVDIGYYVLQVQRSMNLENHKGQMDRYARRGNRGADNIVKQNYHAGFGPVYNMVIVVPENIGVHKPRTFNAFGVRLEADEITNFLSSGFSFYASGGKPPVLMAGVKKTTSPSYQYDDLVGLMGGKQGQ